MKNTKLINLKTKNFKGLGSFEYSPKSNDINIIYGDNGVGKSSLIKIFNFFTIVTNQIRLRNMNQAFGPAGIPFSPSLNNPFGAFSEIGNTDPIEFEMTIEMDGSFYRYGFLLNKQNHITYEEFVKLNKTNLSDKKVIFKKKLYESFEIDQDIFKEFKIIKNELTEENLNSFIAIIDYVNNTNEFTDETNLDPKTSNNPITLLTKAITVLNVANHENHFEEIYSRSLVSLPVFQIHPGDKINKKLFYEQAEDFEEFVMDIDDKIMGVEVRENISNDGRVLTLSLVYIINIDNRTREIPSELMSSGTQDYLKYFRIITLLKNKINGNVTSSLIMFDEFGIHLHPSLAVNILNLITKLSVENDTQIILTSHQAILLDKKLTNLKNKNKNIMLKNINGSTTIKSLVNTGNKENHFEKYIRGYYGGNDLNILGDEYE